MFSYNPEILGLYDIDKQIKTIYNTNKHWSWPAEYTVKTEIHALQKAAGQQATFFQHYPVQCQRQRL